MLPAQSALATENAKAGTRAISPADQQCFAQTGDVFRIFRLLEQDLPVSFKMTDLPWKRAILRGGKRRWGIIPFSKNAERVKSFDYSDEIFTDEIVLVVLRGSRFPFQAHRRPEGQAHQYLGGATVGENSSGAFARYSRLPPISPGRKHG